MTRQALLLLLVLSAACGSEVRAVESGSSSGSSSSSEAGGTGGAAGGGGMASVGSGGMGGGMGGMGGMGGTVVSCFPPGAPPEPAPLCGPADAPCKVLADEVLPVLKGPHDDAPGLALSDACLPEILISSLIGDSPGFHAVKNPMGEWSVQPTPFPVVSGALVRHPSGSTLAIPNDGAGASIWSFSGDGWTLVSELPGKAGHFERSVAEAPNGDVYVGALGAMGDVVFGHYTNGWSTTSLGTAWGLIPVSVSPDGAPHLVHWTSFGGSWELRWLAPPMESERVFFLGSISLELEVQRPVLAVTDADEKNPMGKPHGLAVRIAPGGNGFEMVYFTREVSGWWKVTSLETISGDQNVFPLGAVTDGHGDVRLFYARTSWGAPATGQIVAVWPTPGGSVDKAVVMDGISPTGATFERDRAGRIHVALYSDVVGAYPDVRYVILGI